MIRTHALTKRFGTRTAVDSVDLDVREGDIYGFLGANGSGKTTTVRMLLGLVLATSGDIEVLGQPMPRAQRAVLPAVGALVEGPAAYPHLSGRAHLSMLDAAGGGTARRGRRHRVSEVLEQVGLDPADRRGVRTYSLGMKQRLGLANALLRRPALLVLDEPTNGLDPHGIHEIRDLLSTLNAAGTTVFLSSHLLAEVEQICTRVGVLDRGRLVVQERLDVLLGRTGRTILHTPDVAAARSALGERVVEIDGSRLVIDESAPTPDLVALLIRSGVRVHEVAPERRTLEDVVLASSRAAVSSA